MKRKVKHKKVAVKVHFIEASSYEEAKQKARELDYTPFSTNLDTEKVCIHSFTDITEYKNENNNDDFNDSMSGVWILDDVSNS